jgi:hypothetical protein
MDKNTVLAIIVGVLVVIAAVQAVELSMLNSRIATSGLKAGSAARTVSVQSSGGAAATGGTSGTTDLNNLPGMVGGC